MLCPKCDHISFDHLSICTNCNHDLSALVSEISGTAVQAEQHSFLNSVLKMESSEDDTQFSDTEPQAEDGAEQDMDGADALVEEDTEEVDIPQDLGAEQELNLEEEASLDLSVSGVEEEAEGSAESEEDEDGTPELQLDDVNVPEGASVTLDMDSTEEDITLETDEEDIGPADSDEEAGEISLQLEDSGSLEGEVEPLFDLEAEALEEQGLDMAEAGLEGPEEDADQPLDLSLGSDQDSEDDLSEGEQVLEEAVGSEADLEESGGIELHLDLAQPEDAAGAVQEETTVQEEETQEIVLDVSSLSMEKHDSPEQDEEEGPDVEAAENEPESVIDNAKTELTVDLENIDLSDLVQASDDPSGDGEKEGDDTGPQKEINLDDPASIYELSLELDSDDEGDGDGITPVDLTGTDSEISDLPIDVGGQEESSLNLEDDGDEIIIDLSLESDEQ